MEAGKQPVVFENPTYAAKDNTSKVVSAAQGPSVSSQVTVSENVENQNYGSPIDPSEIVPEPKPASPGADESQVM